MSNMARELVVTRVREKIRQFFPGCGPPFCTPTIPAVAEYATNTKRIDPKFVTETHLGMISKSSNSCREMYQNWGERGKIVVEFAAQG